MLRKGMERVRPDPAVPAGHRGAGLLRGEGLVIRLALFAAAAVGVCLATAAGAAGLRASGVELADVQVVPASAEVVVTVDLNGDSVEASYVTAAMPDGRRLMRSHDGYWLDWDGRADNLVDNRFAASGDRLTFKVLKEDLSARFFPINVTVAYKTGAAIKFGVFQVVPR